MMHYGRYFWLICSLFLLSNHRTALAQSDSADIVCVYSQVDQKLLTLVHLKQEEVFSSLVHAMMDGSSAKNLNITFLDARSSGSEDTCTRGKHIKMVTKGFPDTFAYKIDAEFSYLGKTYLFSIERPTGERPDVLPIGGAPTSSYVRQSLSMDIRELAEKIVVTISKISKP